MFKLKELKWDITSHPSYFSDIEPSDYHLFRLLENNVNKKKNSHFFKVVKSHIFSFFNVKPRSFYDRGILILSKRWEKIVEKTTTITSLINKKCCILNYCLGFNNKSNKLLHSSIRINLLCELRY